MPDLMILGKNDTALSELQAVLTRNGFTCSAIPYSDDVAEYIFRRSPDIVLAEIDGYQPDRLTREQIHEIKLRSSVPVIAVVSRNALDYLDVDPNMDDFISQPVNQKELLLRIKRILKRQLVPNDRETIVSDGMVIDLARCEVTVDGKKVELTFKEYELLKFLAGNTGRVFTRESLLDKIWGMDYFGGDRTVDVHIRRLRSKIEQPGKVFIETVRNIGYRFRVPED